jgi:hypothetical protein
MQFNLRQYRLSKLFVADLCVIIKDVQVSINTLSKFKHYKPVKQILDTLNTEMEKLKLHEIECKKIVNSKGQVKAEGTND